jgi:hypothetical protein
VKQHEQQNAYGKHKRRHPEMAVGQHRAQIRRFQVTFPSPNGAQSRRDCTMAGGGFKARKVDLAGLAHDTKVQANPPLVAQAPRPRYKRVIF